MASSIWRWRWIGSCTDHHLLGPQREILDAVGETDLDQHLAAITKVNQLFTFGLYSAQNPVDAPELRQRLPATPGPWPAPRG